MAVAGNIFIIMRTQKIFKHYQYVREHGLFSMDSLLIPAANSIGSFLILVIYLCARPSLSVLSAGYKNLFFLGCTILFAAFLISVPHAVKPQTKTLFKLLQFTHGDFVVHTLLLKNLDIIFSSITISCILHDCQIGSVFLFQFSAVFFIHIAGVLICGGYQPLLKIPTFHSIKNCIRLKTQLGAYLYKNYWGNQNRFSILFGIALAILFLVVGVYYTLPFGLVFYLMEWTVICGLTDLAIGDENDYCLNILLQITPKKLIRKKRIHSMIQSLLYCILLFLSYRIFQPDFCNPEMLLTAGGIFLYCLIISYCYTEYIYSHYPYIQNHESTFVLTSSLFAIPGVGLLFSIYMTLIKRKNGCYTED